MIEDEGRPRRRGRLGSKLRYIVPHLNSLSPLPIVLVLRRRPSSSISSARARHRFASSRPMSFLRGNALASNIHDRGRRTTTTTRTIRKQASIHSPPSPFPPPSPNRSRPSSSSFVLDFFGTSETRVCFLPSGVFSPREDFSQQPSMIEDYKYKGRPRRRGRLGSKLRYIVPHLHSLPPLPIVLVLRRRPSSSISLARVGHGFASSRPVSFLLGNAFSQQHP